jgi:hypothetical protein
MTFGLRCTLGLSQQIREVVVDERVAGIRRQDAPIRRFSLGQMARFMGVERAIE